MTLSTNNGTITLPYHEPNIVIFLIGKSGLSLKNKQTHNKTQRHLNKIKEIENNNNIPICCNELTNIFSSPDIEVEVELIYDCAGNDVSDLIHYIHN